MKSEKIDSLSSDRSVTDIILGSWQTPVPRLLAIDDAAKYLGLPRGTVAVMFQNSDIKTTTIGKTRFTTVECLEDFIEHHGLKPRPSER